MWHSKREEKVTDLKKYERKCKTPNSSNFNGGATGRAGGCVRWTPYAMTCPPPPVDGKITENLKFVRKI